MKLKRLGKERTAARARVTGDRVTGRDGAIGRICLGDMGEFPVMKTREALLGLKLSP
jgi:hypothetical protein